MADRDAVVTSSPYPLEEPGLWVERIGDRVFPTGTPALFLDRDGTINVDTGYPNDPAEIVLRDDIAPAIAAANRAGIPVIIVTNQSGIARGYFGWSEFAAVNGRVLELLGERGRVRRHGACLRLSRGGRRAAGDRRPSDAQAQSGHAARGGEASRARSPALA